MGRRICKDIAVGILDNMESYMLSNMCHTIIMDTTIPGALELVSRRSARKEKQSALREAWMGRRVCQDAMNNKLIDNISLVGEHKVELERLKKRFA